MQLLTFAHRAEASAFFPSESWRPVKEVRAELFAINDHIRILITGEGLHAASINTATALTFLGEACGEVLNFGVVGALQDASDQRQVISIRTVYGQGYPGPLLYHTFRSQDPHANIDCLSATQRVLDVALRTPLAAFAEVVDRELWAIASVCQHFDIPWKSWKIVSDSADDPERCSVIKDEAHKYSLLLWEAFQGYLAKEQETPKYRQNMSVDLPPSTSDHLHFSKSQKDLRAKLLHMIATRSQVSQSDVWQRTLTETAARHEARWPQIRPKERARLCLTQLQSMAYPERTALRQQLSDGLNRITPKGFQATLSANIEEPRLQLEGPLLTLADLSTWRSFLGQSDWGAICQLLDGTATGESPDVP